MQMFRHEITGGVLIVLVLVFAGCATTAVKSNDPLIGNVIRSADGAPVSIAELLDVVAAADVIYLGEKHDNRRHHDIQVEIITELLQRGKKPVLALEFFAAVESGFLLNYLRKDAAPTMWNKSKSPEDILRDQVSKRTVESANYPFYLALLQLAREYGLQAYGVDLPPALRLRLTREGRAGITPIERGRLYPTRARSRAYRDLMLDKLKDAHCGYGAAPYLERLYETWIARNDAMAAVVGELLGAAAGQPLVVILGAGHVQHNAGVLAQVAASHPESTQVNIGLREVNAAPGDFEEYLAVPTVDGVRFGPDHEYLWFTSRVDTGDPCAGFGRHGARKDPAS